MAEIDPITREALKRATQMHGQRMRAAPSESVKEQRRDVPKPENPPKENPIQKTPIQSFGLEALFKDKETSVILILIVLLMGEKDCEHLLLALIYLLL